MEIGKVTSVLKAFPIYSLARVNYTCSHPHRFTAFLVILRSLHTCRFEKWDLLTRASSYLWQWQSQHNLWVLIIWIIDSFLSVEAIQHFLYFRHPSPSSYDIQLDKAQSREIPHRPLQKRTQFKCSSFFENGEVSTNSGTWSFRSRLGGLVLGLYLRDPSDMLRSFQFTKTSIFFLGRFILWLHWSMVFLAWFTELPIYSNTTSKLFANTSLVFLPTINEMISWYRPPIPRLAFFLL